MKKFQIIVEGDADKKFFENYYHHLFHEKAPNNSIIHLGELIKERNRKYDNMMHWNLDAEYLEPLKKLLMRNISEGSR